MRHDCISKRRIVYIIVMVWNFSIYRKIPKHIYLPLRKINGTFTTRALKFSEACTTYKSHLLLIPLQSLTIVVAKITAKKYSPRTLR